MHRRFRLLPLLFLIAIFSIASAPPHASHKNVLSFTSTSDARARNMTLRVDGERLVLVDDASAEVLAEAETATTRRVVVQGAAGSHDDVLTVDLSGLALPDGIDYDGGAAGWDTLVLKGGAAQKEQVVQHLSSADGIIDFETVRIRFANLEPITDTTTTATYTINATPGGEEIRVVDGAPGTTRVDSGGSGSFESVDFANKTTVTVNGVAGSDIFIVDNPNPAPGLTSITLNGTTNVNTFWITPSATVTYTVVGDLPAPPGSQDLLVVALSGVTSPVLSIASDASGLVGSFSFGNRQPVNFSQVEDLNPANIYISKTGPDTVVAGGTATYVVTVTNGGPSDAANVAMIEPLPGGMTFVSVTQLAGPASACDTPGVGATGTVACMTPVLLNTEVVQYQIVAQVPSGTAAGTIFSNTASVTSGTSETNPGDNSATRNATATVSANVAVTKTAPATVLAGQPLTWTIEASNVGPSDAQSVVLTDTLPAGTTFASATASGGFICMTPAVGASGLVTCSSASLVAGATATITLVATVSPTATGTITNTATIATTTPDADAINNTSSASTTVTAAQADVGVTKTAAAATVTTGGDITYTIVATNSGPSPATGVAVVDVLPAGTTFVSATATQGTCSGTATVNCAIGTLASGASATVTLVIAAPVASGVVTNTAEVSATEPDPTPANNTESETVTVAAAGADLAITKTTASTTVTTGATISYTITVTNNGPAVATGVTVEDILPAGTTFVSATPGQGTCSGTTTVTCAVGTLASATSATITLVVQAPATSGTVTNTATVTASEADASPANNAAAAPAVTVTAQAVPPAAVPTLSEMMLMLVAAMLAGVALFKLR